MSPASPVKAVLATEAGRLHSLGLVLRALVQADQSAAGAPRYAMAVLRDAFLALWHGRCLQGTPCKTKAANGQARAECSLMGLLLLQ